MVSISIQARNDAGDAIVDLIDDGTTHPNGILETRTGNKPANPQSAVTGTKLTTHHLSMPAFGNFNNGIAQANPITQDEVAVTGKASWFRIYDRDRKPVLDGEIGLQGSGKDIEFDKVDFIRGGTVTVTQIQAIMPQ